MRICVKKLHQKLNKKMITIYYQKKKIYVIATIFLLLFLTALVSIFYFLNNPKYVNSAWFFKLPGIQRVGVPVSAWWIATVSSLLLGWCVYMLWRMLENKPVVSISREGVAIKNLPFIAWHLIDIVRITEVKGQKFVEIRLHDMHAYKKRLTWPYVLLFKLNDMVGDFHVSLPTMLTMKHEEIVNVINSYKKN